MKLFFKYGSSLLFVFIILFQGCEKEEKIIPEEKFIEIYVDFIILQDTTITDTLSLDSLKTLVFTKHKVSDDYYASTINYYNSQPKRWKEFFDKAIAYAEKLKNEAEKQRDTLKEQF